MDITHLNAKEMESFGRDMLNAHRDRFSSFQEAAQQCVEDIFNELQQPNGDPAFALVRIFHVSPVKSLPKQITQMLNERSQFAIVLMGSMGLEPEWRDPRQSQNRRAIPVGDDMSPMFKGVFSELGFNWSEEEGVDVPRGKDVAMPAIRAFHVPDASQSEFITDQNTFVRPYGIQSVIAVGTDFISGSAYVAIGFSMVPLSQENVNAFAQIGPFLSTLLAIYDEGDLW